MKEVMAIFQVIAVLLEAVTALGYDQENIKIHNYQQKIYMVEASLEKGAVLSSSLAQDSVFGFESLGHMAKKHQAVLGVNGMFFDDLGSPAGLLCEGGRWIRMNDIGTPSLVIDREASIQDIKVRAFWRTTNRSGEIFSLNIGAYPGYTNVFTREYGSSNRVFRPQVTYQIEEGKVAARYLIDEPVEIGRGYVVTYLLGDDIDMASSSWQSLPEEIPVFEIGQDLAIEFQVLDQEGREIQPQNVYQCGGGLIRKQEIQAKEMEQFIGYTTSLQPRTAVGINKKGNIMFFIVDGRQKGIAEGLTGQWLAEFISQYDITDAGYLDGGASSMLWMQGGLVNQVSYPNMIEGKEIAHAILLNRKIKEQRQRSQ